MNTVEQWKHPLDVIDDVRAYADEELSFAEIEEPRDSATVARQW